MSPDVVGVLSSLYCPWNIKFTVSRGLNFEAYGFHYLVSLYFEINRNLNHQGDIREAAVCVCVCENIYFELIYIFISFDTQIIQISSLWEEGIALKELLKSSLWRRTGLGKRHKQNDK